MTTMSGEDDVYDVLSRRSFMAYAHPAEAARLRAEGYVEGVDYVSLSPLPSGGMHLTGRTRRAKIAHRKH